MHKINPKDYRAKVHPRGRDDLPLTGVLATRGCTHPNPIGLAVVELFGEKGNRLKVRRLDDYNGLKPISNQYKPGPIEQMLILNIGQQVLLCSL
jgi:tRNA (Thr-GGU) A37 N-methylase